MKLLIESFENNKFRSDNWFKKQYPKEFAQVMNLSWGESFREKLFIIKNGILEDNVICKYGQKKKFNNYFSGYKQFCQKHCYCSRENQALFLKEKPKEYFNQIYEKSKKTFLEKYGVDNPMKNIKIIKKRNITNSKKFGGNSPMNSDKVKETLIKNNQSKYGVDYTLQCDAVKNKIKTTNIEKFGGPSPFTNTTIQNKIKQTNLKKYNVDNPFKSKDIQNKIKNNNIKKYGVSYPLESKQVRDKIAKSNIQKELYHANHINWSKTTKEILYNKDRLIEICQKYKNTSRILTELNCDRTTFLKYYHNYSLETICPLVINSLHEIKIKELLETNNIICSVNNKKIIPPQEIDIFIPEHNLAIELNGIYWHSEIFKDSNYHYLKFKKCIEQNIQLIQFWESDLDVNFNIISNMILYKCKQFKKLTGARNCKIEEISYSNGKQLLEQYHIQGSSKNSSIYIGGIYNNNIVGVMSFTKKHNNVYELNRFAVSNPVPGLFSRMLSYFENNYKPSKIISYSDNMYSLGNLYYKNNFTLSHDVPVSYYYTDLKSVFHRSLFSKNNIKKKFNICDLNKTEKEIMKELGYLRLYDAGKKCWVKQY